MDIIADETGFDAAEISIGAAAELTGRPKQRGAERRNGDIPGVDTPNRHGGEARLGACGPMRIWPSRIR